MLLGIGLVGAFTSAVALLITAIAFRDQLHSAAVGGQETPAAAGCDRHGSRQCIPIMRR